MNRMWDVDSSPEAVAIELEVQAWSLQQPDFKERIAALAKEILTACPSGPPLDRRKADNQPGGRP